LNSPYLNVFVKFILQNKMNCSLSPEWYLKQTFTFCWKALSFWGFLSVREKQNSFS
jgi:hypothetical protein